MITERYTIIVFYAHLSSINLITVSGQIPSTTWLTALDHLLYQWVITIYWDGWAESQKKLQELEIHAGDITTALI